MLCDDENENYVVVCSYTEEFSMVVLFHIFIWELESVWYFSKKGEKNFKDSKKGLVMSFLEHQQAL